MAQLMSENYRSQQRHLHETTEYGTVARQFGPLVSQIAEQLKISTLLDYGCGRRMGLLTTLRTSRALKYQGYDPGAGVEELAVSPVPAQMVCCIDVLEHIEPEFLEDVLDHLASLTQMVAFLTIHTGPAMKTLPDGRNAHLIQQEMSWWLPKIWARWDIQSVQRTHEQGFYCVVSAKPRTG
jgi:methyltransferase family protein